MPDRIVIPKHVLPQSLAARFAIWLVVGGLTLGGCTDAPDADELPRPAGTSLVTEQVVESSAGEFDDIRYLLITGPYETSNGLLHGERKLLARLGWHQRRERDQRWEARSPDDEFFVSYQADHCSAPPAELQKALRAKRREGAVVCASIARP